jgi:hypothetical protein
VDARWDLLYKGLILGISVDELRSDSFVKYVYPRFIDR